MRAARSYHDENTNHTVGREGEEGGRGKTAECPRLTKDKPNLKFGLVNIQNCVVVPRYDDAPRCNQRDWLAQPFPSHVADKA